MIKSGVNGTFFQEVRHGGHNCLIPCEDVVVFRVNNKKGSHWKVSSMLSDAFCVMFVKEGTVGFSVDYHSGIMCEGTLLFLTPRMVLSLGDTEDEFSLEGVCFSPSFFDDLSSRTLVYDQMISFIHENQLPVLGPSRFSVEPLSRTMRLFSDISGARFHHDGLLLHLSNLFMLQVAELLHTDGVVSDKGRESHSVELYRSFRKLLSKHYHEKHYIAFYAGCLGISPTYLSRVVRLVSGRTVNYHISHLLLTESRRLLDCTDEPVKRIADKLGFADQASFGKFFKEQMGLSPTAYRRKNDLSDG